MSAGVGDAPSLPARAVPVLADETGRKARSHRFENVNLLRAFAALAVVVYHIIEHGRWASFPTEGPLVAFRIGWIGVDLFFVISGFVIAYSALALYRDEPREFRQRYWSRRLTRILPLYLLTLVLWMLFVSRGFFLRPDWPWQLFTHLAFIHSSWPETHGAIDGVNWTLAVEMQFYVLIALLVPWIDRTPAWRIWLYGTAIAIAWRAIAFVLHGPGDPWLTFIGTQQLPGSLDEFGAGVFLAKWIHRRRGDHRNEGAMWLAGAIMVGAVVLAVYWRYASYWDLPAMVVFWRSALAAFLVCVVAAAVRLPQAIATRGLRPLRYLGEVSYGIYLWHLFAIQLVIHKLGITGPAALAPVLGLTVLAAAVSWHAVERPFMARARR